MFKRLGLHMAVGAIASLMAMTAPQAQDWPPEQMKIVISHDVGSSQNATTRVLGEFWEKRLGTKFIYENRDGASGRIGYDYFLNQPDDGSVILSSNLASASIMYAQQKPDWKWKEALLPVAVFGVDPGVIFVRKDSPYKTFQDLIDAAKKQKLTLGVSFWASPENLQVHQVMDATGAKFEVIPVESSGELVTQVIGGHIEVGYNKAAIVERAGDALRVIAVPLPDNPIPHLTNDAPTVDSVIDTDTMAIASYRGILVHKSWADANPEALKKLETTLRETIEDPEFVAAIQKQGIDPKLTRYMGTEEIYSKVLNRYWTAFDKFGDIYSKK